MDDHTTDNGRIDRRTYLKALGTSALVAGTASSSDLGGDGDGETLREFLGWRMEQVGTDRGVFAS